MYETFQNCPRLTDQLLEANGSRRFLKRKEMDEMMEETEDENLSNWDKEVFGMLNETTRDSAKQPSVCAWDDGFDGKCEVRKTAKFSTKKLLSSCLSAIDYLS